ncbi:MAG: hypothetical protein ACYCO9_22280 [Streptosporangiaceae bacterium]
MRTVTRFMAVAGIGAALLVAGCGRPGTSSGGSAAASSSSRPAVRCITPQLSASGLPGPARTFTLSERDSGKTYCVTAGTEFYVFLHGTAAQPWGAITPSTGAVQHRASGVMTLALGVTGGFFQATRLGTVTLTSYRKPCSGPAGGASQCGPKNVFKVTFVVHGKA